MGETEGKLRSSDIKVIIIQVNPPLELSTAGQQFGQLRM